MMVLFLSFLPALTLRSASGVSYSFPGGKFFSHPIKAPPVADLL